jgi:16S rRNA (cytosine1402-N4)-methyltransferase
MVMRKKHGKYKERDAWRRQRQCQGLPQRQLEQLQQPQELEQLEQLEQQQAQAQVQMQAAEHVPVLAREVDENLQVCPDGIYVDATFGRGGHSKMILQQLNQQGRLLVIDKDPDAIEEAMSWQDERVIARHGSFINMGAWLQEVGWFGKVKGILLDLGVSSPQLDQAARGFSFMHDGPLDMRMNPAGGVMSAADWVNRARVEELAEVFKEYGEERFSKRIARAIVEARMRQPIMTTGALAAIVSAAHPRWEQHKHPATRVFQATRIFINNELNELQEVLLQSLDALCVGGRLLVIAFHSLEDRIVKRFMQQHTKQGTVPIGVPVKHEQLRLRLRRVGSALRANVDEIKKNPRARSATLRVMEKIL